MEIGKAIQAILRCCLSNLSACNFSINYWGGGGGGRFIKYAVEMASCGMIYIPSFLKIGTDIQEILSFCSAV
jgi:hypothetical protein